MNQRYKMAKDFVIESLPLRHADSASSPRIEPLDLSPAFPQLCVTASGNAPRKFGIYEICSAMGLTVSRKPSTNNRAEVCLYGATILSHEGKSDQPSTLCI